MYSFESYNHIIIYNRKISIEPKEDHKKKHVHSTQIKIALHKQMQIVIIYKNLIEFAEKKIRQKFVQNIKKITHKINKRIGHKKEKKRNIKFVCIFSKLVFDGIHLTTHKRK